MSLEEATRSDGEGAVEKAASLYEEALVSGECAPEAFLNLLILYWQATDYGFSTARALRSEFVAKAGKRIPGLLRNAAEALPGNSEVRFWQRYIPWADLGDEFSVEECERFLHEDPRNLVPAMYLYSQSEGKKWQDEARELLRRCSSDASHRSKYITSVLQGVMKRGSWSASGGKTS